MTRPDKHGQEPLAGASQKHATLIGHLKTRRTSHAESYLFPGASGTRFKWSPVGTERTRIPCAALGTVASESQNASKYPRARWNHWCKSTRQ